jgi:hypothetical protein
VTIYIFAGPTIGPQPGLLADDSVWLPPAGLGDIYRAASRSPRAIGLIDGVFGDHPPVWHKEILWAMSRGIAVFGAASMGALRAAELASFGMIGVGKIFSDFASGRLTDDDEVAQLHGPIESGYVRLSEALVNIRATLARAAASRIISRRSAKLLTQAAKAQFYQDRTWPAVLEFGLRHGISKSERDRLQRWLAEGAVDCKAADAKAMLVAMKRRLRSRQEPASPRWRFEHTENWERLVARASLYALPAADASADADINGVLDELRLSGGAFDIALTAALSRTFALNEAARQRISAGAERLVEEEMQLRTRLGLKDKSSVRRWLRANKLRSTDFARILEDSVRADTIRAIALPAALGRIIDYLRENGMYPTLLARARRKRQTLSTRGLSSITISEFASESTALLQWYAANILGRPLPPDLRAHLSKLGFSSASDLLTLVLRERLYRELGNSFSSKP